MAVACFLHVHDSAFVTSAATSNNRPHFLVAMLPQNLPDSLGTLYTVLYSYMLLSCALAQDMSLWVWYSPTLSVGSALCWFRTLSVRPDRWTLYSLFRVMKRLAWLLAITLVWIPTITCEEFPSQGNSSLGVFGPLDPVQTEFSRIHSNAIGWNGSLPFHDPNSTYFRVSELGRESLTQWGGGL